MEIRFEPQDVLYVVLMRDRDGYDIPVGILTSREDADKFIKAFREDQKENSYWDWDFDPSVEEVYLYEEVIVWS